MALSSDDWTKSGSSDGNGLATKMRSMPAASASNPALKMPWVT